jgi:hypothetical protein
MKKTVLKFTQEILSALDSDEVNSIYDTEEAMQVALILEGVYYDMLIDLEVKEGEDVFHLWDGQGTEAAATMTLPPTVSEVAWIKYNGKQLVYRPFSEFIDALPKHADSGTNHITTNSGERWELGYDNTRDPKFFTTLDDNLLIFDACKDGVLMPSATLGYGIVFPEFKQENDFVVPINISHTRYYLNRAKARAFAELKETSNQDAVAEARLQRKAISRQKEKQAPLSLFDKRPQFGRKPRR